MSLRAALRLPADLEGDEILIHVADATAAPAQVAVLLAAAARIAFLQVPAPFNADPVLARLTKTSPLDVGRRCRPS